MKEKNYHIYLHVQCTSCRCHIKKNSTYSIYSENCTIDVYFMCILWHSQQQHEQRAHLIVAIKCQYTTDRMTSYTHTRARAHTNTQHPQIFGKNRIVLYFVFVSFQSCLFQYYINALVIATLLYCSLCLTGFFSTSLILYMPFMAKITVVVVFSFIFTLNTKAHSEIRANTHRHSLST